MSGGYMNEAFVDFTGGIGEAVHLKTPNPKLFRTIKEALRKRSMMGAHIQVGAGKRWQILTLPTQRNLKRRSPEPTQKADCNG